MGSVYEYFINNCPQTREKAVKTSSLLSNIPKLKSSIWFICFPLLFWLHPLRKGDYKRVSHCISVYTHPYRDEDCHCLRHQRWCSEGVPRPPWASPCPWGTTRTSGGVSHVIHYHNDSLWSSLVWNLGPTLIFCLSNFCSWPVKFDAFFILDLRLFEVRRFLRRKLRLRWFLFRITTKWVTKHLIVVPLTMSHPIFVDEPSQINANTPYGTSTWCLGHHGDLYLASSNLL